MSVLVLPVPDVSPYLPMPDVVPSLDGVAVCSWVPWKGDLPMVDRGNDKRWSGAHGYMIETPFRSVLGVGDVVHLAEQRLPLLDPIGAHRDESPDVWLDVAAARARVAEIVRVVENEDDIPDVPAVIVVNPSQSSARYWPAGVDCDDDPSIVDVPGDWSGASFGIKIEDVETLT